jgi:phage gp46-like protein
MLKLIQTNWCEFNLAFDDPTAVDTDAAVATLVFAVLFTDQQAPAARVSDPYDRRGWYKDAEAGSGLWHIRRQPLTPEAEREAVARVEMALKTKTPALVGVTVQAVKTPDPAGNVSSVYLEIAGLHNGHKFLIRAPLSDS